MHQGFSLATLVVRYNEILPETNIDDTFTGLEVTIQVSDVGTFCSVVLHQ